MVKLVILIRRKDGMSRAAFIEHYETRHVPLVRRLLPQIVRYRRNYVRAETVIAMAPDSSVTRDGVPFDVVTEAFYADRASYDAMLASMADPTIGAEISADEDMFTDRAATTLFLVDEHVD